MKYVLILFCTFTIQGYCQNDGLIDTNFVLEKIQNDTPIDRDIRKRALFIPRIKDDFTTNGKVVLDVCIDNKGDVITANILRAYSVDYTEELIRIARNNAFQYKFNKSDFEEQCGTITYKFNLKGKKAIKGN